MPETDRTNVLFYDAGARPNTYKQTEAGRFESHAGIKIYCAFTSRRKGDRALYGE